MDTVKKMLPFLLAMAIDFYILPLLIRDTGSAMLLMLVVIPLLCFACAAAYGGRHGFHPLFALAVAVLFVPSIFLYYNPSAWMYSVGYGIVSLLGNALGSLFYKRPK
ncbi:hypothetical protein [Harryflintia acetispora]|uniref:hypothetical protein n=1 Tax=Harryflintia acetispora TaxID=1849041 RepID=UPI00189A9D2C|nr:hypothetical protein [Harryflintia acetispora]